MGKLLHMIKKITKCLKYYIDEYRKERENKDSFASLNLPNLTKEEKNIIKSKWGKFVYNISLCYYEYRVYKHVYGFDVNFIPLSVYVRLLDKLNFKNDRIALSNKSLFPLYLSNVNQPHTICYSIGGMHYNSNHDIISQEEVVSIICGQGTLMIAKPSVDTACGKGVVKLDAYLNKDDVKQLLTQLGNDYIIQRKVDQCEVLNYLNKSSLNTFRVTSVLLNNKIVVTSICLKIGKNGALCDNLGFGGIIVGVNIDGTLKEYGVDKNGNKYDSFNGILLKDVKIPMINDVINIAKKTHMMLPTCRIVGCDIAVDEDNKALLIEANLKFPGITLEQMCTGPILESILRMLFHY